MCTEKKATLNSRGRTCTTISRDDGEEERLEEK